MGLRTRRPRNWDHPPGLSRRARRPSLERLEARLLLAAPRTLEFTGSSPTVLLSDVQPATLPHVVINSSNGTASTISFPTTYTPNRAGTASNVPPEFFVKAVGGSSLGAWSATSDQLNQAGQAQPLPDKTDVTVAGEIGAKNGGPTYSVQIDAGMQALGINVQPSSPSMPLPEGIAVFDEAGHELMKGLPDPRTHTIHLDLLTVDMLVHGRRAHALYLQIFLPSSAATAGSGSIPLDAFNPELPVDSTVMGFLLSVQRWSVTPVSISLPLAIRISLPAPTPFPSVYLGGSASPAAYGAASVAIPTVQIITGSIDSTGPGRVATGPLPTRGSAPLGGVLSGEGDPAPVVPRDHTAAVDLALTDLSRGDAEAAPPPDQVPRSATPLPSDGAIAALRGPGGFPLFGTALIAEGQSTRLGVEDRLPMIAVARSAPVLPDPGAATSPNETEPEPLPAPRASRTVRRLSALTGVSLALAFVSGSVLPAITDPAQADPPPRSWLRRFLPGRRSRFRIRAKTAPAPST